MPMVDDVNDADDYIGDVDEHFGEGGGGDGQ